MIIRVACPTANIKMIKGHELHNAAGDVFEKEICAPRIDALIKFNQNEEPVAVMCANLNNGGCTLETDSSKPCVYLEWKEFPDGQPGPPA